MNNQNTDKDNLTNSNTDNNKDNNTYQDIDLLGAFISACKSISKAIKLFFTGLCNAIVYLLNLTIRHFFLLSAGVILAFLTVFLLGRNSALNKLESSVKINCPPTLSSNIEEEISKLNTLILTKNIELLASDSFLNISPSLAQKLCKIKVGYAIDNNNDLIEDFVTYKKEEAGNTYKIVTNKDGLTTKTIEQQRITSILYLHLLVKGNNTSDFSEIQNAILNYINGITFLKNKTYLYRKSLTKQIETISNQISLLDSLQKIEYLENARKKSENGGGVQLYMQAENKNEPTLYHTHILKLVEDKNILEQDLDKYKETVNSNTQLFPTRVSLFKEKLIILCSIIVLFVLAAILSERKNSIIAYIKKERQKGKKTKAA